MFCSICVRSEQSQGLFFHFLLFAALYEGPWTLLSPSQHLSTGIAHIFSTGAWGLQIHTLPNLTSVGSKGPNSDLHVAMFHLLNILQALLCLSDSNKSISSPTIEHIPNKHAFFTPRTHSAVPDHHTLGTAQVSASSKASGEKPSAQLAVSGSFS